ncbi:MAG: SurA N-terminal domain-containing protein [Gammaproteobacteria bacterium]|nr:SurA N-terminal domain-containing protein [Gammaproteobacteria bacterium]
MLTSLRDTIKGSRVIGIAFVVIIILAFASFGLSAYLSGGAGEAVAKVNGEEVDQAAAAREYQSQRARLQQMFGGQIPEQFSNTAIYTQAVQSVASRKVVDQLADSLGIGVSDSQLAESIRSTPAFQADGEFDKARYDAVLVANGLTAPGYEAGVRTDLRRIQLVGVLESSAFTTKAEKQLIAKLSGQQREVAWVKLSASALEVESPTEDEIAAHYEQNLSQYMEPEAVKVEYLRLKLADFEAKQAPTADEIEAHFDQTKDRYQTTERRSISHILLELDSDASDEVYEAKREALLALKSQLDSGADFAELAAANSQDVGSAEQGGSLGEFERGALPAAFDEVAFSIEAGVISDVVRTDSGVHLIKVDSIQAPVGKSFDEVRAEVEADLKRVNAEAAFAELSGQLANSAYENSDSLGSVADELNLSLQTSEFFSRSGGSDLAASQAVRAAAFADDVYLNGYNSELIEIEPNQDVVVIRLFEKRPESQKALGEVKDTVVAQLTAQAQTEALAELKSEALAALRESRESMASLAEGQWGELSRAIAKRQGANIDRVVVEAAFSAAAPADGATVYVEAGAPSQAYLVAVERVIDSEPTTAEIDSVVFGADSNVAIDAVNSAASIEINEAAIVKITQ